MKIFVCADIHGNKAIIKKLKRIDKRVDAIFICGDLGGKEIHGKTFKEFSSYQKTFVKNSEERFKTLNTKLKYILGNDDWFESDGEFYLSQPELIGEYVFYPFEYTPTTPFNTNREVNENKMAYELGKLECDANSIVIAHAPPYEAGDKLYSGKHCGSKAIRNWIENVQPRVWINGHIHEDSGYTYIGKTLVINCACDYRTDELSGFVIDLENLEVEEVHY